jgi:type I site-specific restriction endonuclease
MTPEERARLTIDRLLQAAGWVIQDFKSADIHAARGVAIRAFVLDAGQGSADYLLYVGGQAAGVIEAKKQGATLTGVEIQSTRYAKGLPPTLPAWRRPLPFIYESTGAETHFTNGLDPEPRARNVFAFQKPETLAEWLKDCRRRRRCIRVTTEPPITPSSPPQPYSRASARCPSWLPSGATTNSGPLQSPPSAIWRKVSPRAGRAP